MQRLLAGARYRSKKDALPFDLDFAWILARWENGRCEATGIHFALNSNRAWNTPSLDRRDNSRGYTKDNARLILFALNAACGSWGQERLIEIVRALR